MLFDLKVSNFAIIDEVHIKFKNGLNILSGETGAGKSIIIKSLALLMGEKADSQSVRQGAEQASIEGFFDLAHRADLLGKLRSLGINCDEDSLVVRRIVSSQGKNRVYMNDSLVSLNSLRDIVSPLIEVTGPMAPLIEVTTQHENKNLLSKLYQLDLLDQFCGGWSKRLEIEKLYNDRSELEKQITEVSTSMQWREQRLDYLKYQREEIKTFSPSPDDDNNLENNIRVIKNSSQLVDFKNQVDEMLYSDENSVLSLLHKVEQKALYLQKIDSKLGEVLKPLDTAKSLVNDVMYELREYGSNLDINAEELEKLEKRLSDFRNLQKKYGPTSKEMLEYLSNSEAEIAKLENFDQNLEELRQRQREIEKEQLEIASKLHKQRCDGAKLLSQEVNSELKDLNMKGVSFTIKIEKSEIVGPHGITDVEFMTKVSKDGVPLPLAKFASGGELSRILLAIKQVVGQDDKPRTYLFDEVDTGVSGETAEKVGLKLRQIAKNQQVICITHLPQVAAQGDVHFFVSKKVSGSKVKMEISELTSKARVQEVARLISGEKISKTSIAHAEQLLQH